MSAPVVVVVGAGLGGLTAATALRRAGVEVSLFERGRSMHSIQHGIGMIVFPNGVRALEHVGLLGAVKAIGAPLETLELNTEAGRPLATWEIGDVGRRLGVPTLAVSRSELLGALAGGYEGEITFGARFASYAEDAGGVTVRFEDGAETRGDVLIGADGVVSHIRRQLTGKGPPEFPPYAGYTTWHAIIPFGDVSVPAGRFVLYFGRGSRFGHFRLDDERVYWSGIAYVPQGGERDIDKDKVLEIFGGYGGPVRALIEATETMQRHDIFGGATLGSWGAGRVTVLGDAAHPMTTNLGQGVGMAIEDGVVLGQCFEREPDPVAALRAYQRRRIERTDTMMALANRLNADASQESRLRVWMRNQLIARGFQRGVARRYEQFIESEALA